jgi:hypothetical protein
MFFNLLVATDSNCEPVEPEIGKNNCLYCPVCIDKWKFLRIYYINIGQVKKYALDKNKQSQNQISPGLLRS